MSCTFTFDKGLRFWSGSLLCFKSFMSPWAPQSSCVGGGGFVWEHYTVDFEIDWDRLLEQIALQRSFSMSKALIFHDVSPNLGCFPYMHLLRYQYFCAVSQLLLYAACNHSAQEYNKNDPSNIYRPWGFQPGHQLLGRKTK